MNAALTITRPGIGDLAILLLCLMLIPLSLHWLGKARSVPDAIRITSPDTTSKVYPLAPDRTLHVNGRLGTSSIEISNGSARFTSSPCSGKHCVLSGWHSRSGSGMACLPNRVAMTLLAPDDTYDGLNY